MVEAILEFVLGFVGELVFEIVVEILLELGLHGPVAAISSGASNKLLMGSLYLGSGGVLGWLSLLIFPKMAFAVPGFAVFYFLLSPIIAGLSLMTVSWILDRGIENSRWIQPWKFAFGVVFALGYSLSRLIFA